MRRKAFWVFLYVSRSKRVWALIRFYYTGRIFAIVRYGHSNQCCATHSSKRVVLVSGKLLRERAGGTGTLRAGRTCESGRVVPALREVLRGAGGDVHWVEPRNQDARSAACRSGPREMEDARMWFLHLALVSSTALSKRQQSKGHMRASEECVSWGGT